LAGVEPTVDSFWSGHYLHEPVRRGDSGLVDELSLPPDQVLVVMDDFNLSLGTLRFRPQGSDGGHKG
jgi:hypothetical protein